MNYHDMRRNYQPDRVRLIIIAESPPVGDKYFYKATGSPGEPLFVEFMKSIGFGRGACKTKEQGLREFQRRGLVLLDATYTPVNEDSLAKRNAIIERDYSVLLENLLALTPDKSVPVVVIKANVCRVLIQKLRDDGFDVRNPVDNDGIIPLGICGQQPRFRAAFNPILATI